MNSSLLKKTPWLSIFVIQLGVIIGYIIMFILGAFEEQIQGTLEWQRQQKVTYMDIYRWQFAVVNINLLLKS